MAQEWQIEGLQKCELFTSVHSENLALIHKRCHWLNCGEGEQVLGQEDPSSDVFFVIKGTVRAKSYSSMGREVSFSDISEGELFGEFSAIDRRPRSSSVVSLSPCTLARMSAKDFRQTLLENPDTALKLVDGLVAKIRCLNDRIFEFSTLPVHSRIHIELMRMAEHAGICRNQSLINPSPTHHDFATRISTHREAVTKELNNLASEQVVSLGRRRIEIRNVDALRDRVDAAIHR